ncbi:hypothetical protein [Dyella psychrodurans]|uniref:Thiol:disulfide interchange protein DsbD N-terminal domain-containing protein n=1 Tax=Dyella psychrodurans TaxID=1927960 RepID=A0A370WZK1_9GAMM|nr:hypothetical protein [Dyella psychrodurans]RDS81427.1 hypothetical protein DWU99_17315 [Dyella psychrodurans]
MSRIRRTLFCQTLVLGLAALGSTTATLAQTAAPATGLGQAWPNAKDHSRSPYWHVYVFERDGMRYIQINDRQGTVHAALGRAGDMVFALPVGVDAADVTMSSSEQTSTSALPIYQDEAISVMAVPQSNGTVQITVQMTGCEPVGCIGGSVAAQAQ